MILKKPYGLLIKHFRLIHFILTALTIYIAIKSRTLINFFSDYIANNYSVTIVDNMASLYISPFIYLFIVLTLAMLVAVYILLRYKEKPNKMYLITIIYYIIFLIMILVASFLINGLSEGLWEAASARQYRDFATLIYWPQYIFIIILTVRSLGFNVKQFKFKDDLKEMELTDEDSELVEINIGFDTSKFETKIRRLVREFSYYFRENKLIFICIISILFIGFVYILFNSYEKLHYKYDQGEYIYYDGFQFKFDDSIITNLKYNGETISEDVYYLLAKFTVTNNGKEDAKLDYTNFKVYIGRDYYYPILDIGSNFKDYAKPYYGELVRTGDTKTYLFAYALDKKSIKKNLKITIYNGFSLKKKNYTPKTMIIDLNPIVIDSVTTIKETLVNNELSFAGTYLNNSSLIVNDFYIGKKYSYQYEACHFNACGIYNDIVTSDYSLQSKKTLLVFGYEFILDNSSSYYDSVKTFSGFAADFIKVGYDYNGVYKTDVVKNVTPTNLKDKVVLQTNSEIEKAKQVDLLITIRNKNYIINLVNAQ